MRSVQDARNLRVTTTKWCMFSTNVPEISEILLVSKSDGQQTDCEWIFPSVF